MSTGSTIQRDVASAYLAALVRIAAWMVISSAVFRSLGDEAFSMLTLIRGTLSVLAYAFLGLSPALIHWLAVAASKPRAVLPVDEQRATSSRLLDYEHGPIARADEQIRNTYATGQWLALIFGAVTMLLVIVYSAGLSWFHDVPANLERASRSLALLMGVGFVFRLISDAPAALLQVRLRIVLDNALLAASEIIWASAIVMMGLGSRNHFHLVGPWFAVSGALLLATRAVACRAELRTLTAGASRFDRTIARQMLRYGTLFTFAQLANYLYAPIDFILINQLIDPCSVGIYGAAVQIDAGLMLIVSGLAAVMLPRSAMAHAAGDVKTLRQYYIRGTLLSTLMLAGASIVVWWLAPWIFRLWLGDPMLATQQILPLVLACTVAGGSAAVGRSILLAVGKVKPLTLAVLTAAVANVIISFCAVKFFNLGLIGIVLGTICAAVGFGAWMPWYVLRTLNRFEGRIEIDAAAVPPVA